MRSSSLHLLLFRLRLLVPPESLLPGFFLFVEFPNVFTETMHLLSSKLVPYPRPLFYPLFRFFLLNVFPY